jgi:hypothetical protein
MDHLPVRLKGLEILSLAPGEAASRAIAGHNCYAIGDFDIQNRCIGALVCLAQRTAAEKRCANRSAGDRFDESPATVDRPLAVLPVHSVFLRSHAGFSPSCRASIRIVLRRRLNTVRKKSAMSLSDLRQGPTQNIMLTSQIVLTGIAALASLLGVAILRKQSQAKTCPVHSQHVGVIAMLLAYILALHQSLSGDYGEILD